MKKPNLKFCIALVFVLTLCISPYAKADWNEGDPNKMHWPQLPDLTTTGMDVNTSMTFLADDFECTEDGPITDIHIWGSFVDDALPVEGEGSLIFQLEISSNIPEQEPMFAPQVLADDFYCETTGPITDIHIWGSWYHDYPPFGDPGQVTFTLSIHEDIPASESPTGYSMPGALVWKKTFSLGEFDWSVYAEQIEEDYFVPCEPYYESPGDTICFLYNFYIDQSEAFIQEGSTIEPKVYWLNVQAIPADDETAPEPSRFGWKTSYYEWNDNAVYAIGQDPPDTDWLELYYPQGHPYWGQPINLAFAITTDGQFKYEQPPDLEPTGVDVDATMELTFSRPGEPLMIAILYPGDYTVREVDTTENEDWFDPETGLWLDDNHRRAFQYNFPIDEDETLEQVAGNIYWLEIVEVTPSAGEYTFGWKTTQRDLHFMDDAVFRNEQIDYWWPMVYPEGHEYEGETLDLAFVINSEIPEPDLDFGDAPDPNYPTLLVNDGARHIITAGPWMGDATDAPDAEPDGQPVPPTMGDDLDGNDDEDGLILPTLTAGQAITFPLAVNDAVGAGGVVEIWIDYNIDGDWDDAGELAYSAFLPVGINLITINVPAAATPGMSFARGRISTNGTGGLPTGQASDGEVEDTEVYIELPPEKPEVKHLKWSQPPIEVDPMLEDPEYCGWNEESWIQEPCESIPWNSVADDFRCIGSMPISSIHFWGSFIGWDFYNPPLIRPTEWEFRFYANTPAPDDPQVDPNYSHPSELLWKVIVPDDRVFTEWKGYDYYPNMPFETCFQHYVDLEPEEYFWQNEYLEDTNDDVFWLGIRAIYPGDVDIEYPWGWKTRPESWMDDAVHYECHAVSADLVICRYWPIEEPIFGLSFDAAFELDTDPNYIKWEQPFTGIRDWQHYEDILSMATIDQWTEQITKWSQKPDLEDINSLDVDATIEQTWKPQVLADDFMCEATGPITQIDVWGSWYHDHPPFMDPWAVTFTLSIHADLPIGHPENPNPYSIPGDLLWQKEFLPGQFDSWLYEITEEGWFVPCAEPPAYDPVADHNCYIYNFFIDASEAFHQEQGNIYWLDVQAQPLFWPECPEPVRFGWKNSYMEWNDDAVWAVGEDPPLGQWNELRYPSGHPRAGESIDLAFAIYTDVAQKWVQYPELQPSLSIDIDATKEEVWKPQVLADDFECTDTEPITDIHIWASWYHDFWPYGDANNVTFMLSIHEDLPIGDPENPYPYSLPGELLWQKQFQPGDFDCSIYARDLMEGWFVPCGEPPYYEDFADSICWQYDFYIDEEEAFPQQGSTTEPVIYWLDVQAQPNNSLAGTPPEPIRSRFGWKTSREHWNDDAVWAVGEDPPIEPWNELLYPYEHPYEGESIDLAFEITSEIVHEEFVIQSLVADDWLCERRTPVTAIVWFGSYLDYIYETPCSGTLQPAPVPPDHFLIAIYEDVPADDPNNEYDFSHPGRKLWEYAAYDYDEVLVGYDKHPEGVAGPREPVYRYSLRLPEDKWFKQREVGGVYWISIMGVYGPNADLNHSGWGWTIHEYVFGDNAVQGFWMTSFPTEWVWKEIFDQDDNSADMSFILFTDPNECIDCADYNWDDIVNFYDYAIFALDWMWTGPAGGYANGDLNCNGKVDFEDLETFCLQWLDSCP